MALPFIITAATVAYVAIFPAEEGRIESSLPKAFPSSFSITSNGRTILNNPFWIGVGVGMSLTLLSSYEIKRRRLWQRVRLNFLSWLYDIESTLIDSKQKENTKLLHKFRKPHRILQLKGTSTLKKLESNNSCDNIGESHIELVSPDWVPSSNLYCDVVTLPPETELVPKDAEGVEFYYVIKGDGIYVDQNGAKHRISAEYGFIVDPGCHRGFIVEGSTNGLVLFRATDIAISGGHDSVRRLSTTSLTLTLSTIRAGAKKIYQVLEKQSLS